MKKEYLVPAMELTELELQGNILEVSVGELPEGTPPTGPGIKW